MNIKEFTKAEKPGYITRSWEDIQRAIKATGAVNHYIFGGFYEVFTSKPLTEEERAKYEAEAQETLKQGSEAIAKEIDKKILEEILKEHPEYFNKKITS